MAGRTSLSIRRCRNHNHAECYTCQMPRFLKTFLLWLLFAALPLQGVAAAMQMSCGPMAHHDLAGMATSAQTHNHDNHASASHRHDADADQATDHLASPGEKSSATKHAGSSCSACAACCIGAVAPPAASLATPAYSSSLPSVVTPAPLVTGFIPAGLERPPKRITA